MPDKCKDHSGCVERISSLERQEMELWKDMGEQRKRIDSVIMRLNVCLGGIAVACILMITSLLIGKP